jgi:hypothetical protein
MTVNSWGCVCTDAVCEVVPLHEHQREVERMRELLLSFATSSWLNDHHKARIQAVLLGKPADQPAAGVIDDTGCWPFTRIPIAADQPPATLGELLRSSPETQERIIGDAAERGWAKQASDQQAACTRNEAALVQPAWDCACEMTDCPYCSARTADKSSGV